MELLAQANRRLEKLAKRRENLGEEPPIWARGERAAWREAATRLDGQEQEAREAVGELRAELDATSVVEYAARAERAVAEHLIEERIGMRMASVRLDPPAYLVKELGKPPSNPAKRREWDQAGRHIEGYRLEHGIGDRDSAFGAKPENQLAQREQERAIGTLRRSQQSLGLEQAHVIEQTIDLGVEL